MVGKGLLLISQGKLEPSENFEIKPCEIKPSKLLVILNDLKGITNCILKWNFHVYRRDRTMFRDYVPFTLH
jgi:hypothetical protein